MHRSPTQRLLQSAVPLLSLLFLSAAVEAAPPKVVVDIKPIHSLVSGVMAGVGQPELLIRGADSPHNFTLRPSDARRLNNADLIFWVGESLEASLSSILDTIEGRVVELLARQGIESPPLRKAGIWQKSPFDNTTEERHEPLSDHDHPHGNPHIWLSPPNATVMVTHIEHELKTIDPGNSKHYMRNADRLRQRIQVLDGLLEKRLSTVRTQPYIVFHDAYQTFEAHYGLNAVGSVTLTPDRMPGARRIHLLRNAMDELNIRCLFSEPQFQPRLVTVLTEGTTIEHGTLDPLGAGLVPGAEAYFQLMQNMANSLVDCLER
ncbi:MAG: zinc ABC transporter substrate-binding protein [Sedimenticola sp.]